MTKKHIAPCSRPRLALGALILTIAFSFAFSSAIPLPAQTPQGDWMAGFVMPKVAEPQIPARAVRITDFGAKPDGRTLCTEAIAKAIDTLAAQGGGRLIFPAGMWLTARIVLKSNIALETERGALILFSPDHSLYNSRGRSLIFGANLENIAITGPGIFDGNGDAWRPLKRGKATDSQWKTLLASGGRLDEKTQTWYPRATPETWRPRLLVLDNCKRVLLDGPTFQNSPTWNLNPSRCDNLTIRNLTIINPWYAQNGDGLDLESCRNVIVRDSTLDVGDDGLCLKSGSGPEALRDPRPCENILIENCAVRRAHGGFTIGSEMSGGVRNVRVNNCTFTATDIGLRFKTQRGRGNAVEKIYISNIRMANIATDAIGFNMFYVDKTLRNEKEKKPKPTVADETTPQFRDIYIENIICRGAKRAMQLQGLPEMPIRGIHLRDVSITSRTGAVCEDAENITLQNVDIDCSQAPRLQQIRSRDVRVEGGTLK